MLGIGPGAQDTALSKIDTSCFHGHTVVGSPDFSGLLTAFIFRFFFFNNHLPQYKFIELQCGLLF